jgi:hypothetical protein
MTCFGFHNVIVLLQSRLKFSVAVSCYLTITNYNFAEQLLRNSKKNAAELPQFL